MHYLEIIPKLKYTSLTIQSAFRKKLYVRSDLNVDVDLKFYLSDTFKVEYNM